MRLSFWEFYDRKQMMSDRYQEIRFKGKVFVEGVDRSESYRQLFPTPPVGKTILDVGSNYGYYPLMAIHEGAAYCRAIEKRERIASKAKGIARALDFNNLEIICSDIFDYSPEQNFDIVLCLNLIHHFETIERVEEVLDKLYDIVREQMYLIVLVPDDTSQLYTCDKELNKMGERFVRISPRFFIEKYSRERVRVMKAKTYGENRYVIVVTKPRRLDTTNRNG